MSRIWVSNEQKLNAAHHCPRENDTLIELVCTLYHKIILIRQVKRWDNNAILTVYDK